MKSIKGIICIAIFSFVLDGAFPRIQDLDFGQKQISAFLDKSFAGGYPQACIKVVKLDPDSYNVTFCAKDQESYIIAIEDTVKLSLLDDNREKFKKRISSLMATCEGSTHSILDFMQIILGEKSGTIKFEGKFFIVE